MKKLLVILWLAALLAGIAYLFWYNELKYNLPTPVPPAYKEVKLGASVTIPEKLLKQKDKPVFIHFFNPDCPCSRFNLPHFRSLVRKYSDQITFAVVVINKNKKFEKADIIDKVGVDLPVEFDEGIAGVCGVYSTPQAVLIDRNHKLFYRGNYNKSRYCTEKASNYAQMAIDSLLQDSHYPTFGLTASVAYGCELPDCIK